MSKGKYVKRRKKNSFFFYLLLMILIAIFAFSAWYLADYFINSKQQSGEYDDLAALVQNAQASAATKPREPQATVPGNPGDPSDPTDGTIPAEQPLPPVIEDILDEESGVLLEYAPLYEMNTDMAGWIRIENTKVNYPVMHTPGRTDYYLRRNFQGQTSEWGALYAREECDLNEPSDNVTIYGHNMKDGSMFAALNSYRNRDFWKSHRYIQFDTLTEHHTYEIFAVFVTTASEGKGFDYHEFINARDEMDFDTFIAKCLSLSLYGTDIVPEYGDKIICLSTCEYTVENGRLVVAAVRIN